MRRISASLLHLAATALAGAIIGCATSPAARVTRPAAVPVNLAEPVIPHDVELGAIDEFAGQVCGLARDGALYCWGYVDMDGKGQRETLTRPTRIAGLPPLAGFALVRDGLVGWDARGDLVTRVAENAKAPRVLAGGYVAGVMRNGARSISLRRMRVDAASQRCILTTEGRALCNEPPYHGAHFYAGLEGTYRALGSGPLSCAIDRAGAAIEINASSGTIDAASAIGNAAIPAMGARPIGLDDATSLACTWGVPGSVAVGPQACIVDSGGRVRCTDAKLTTALERAAGGVAIREVFASQHMCVRRIDGEARCVTTHWLPDGALLDPLAGVDASRGLAVGMAAICALGGDGIARCWGQRNVPQLGDGTTMELAEPVQLEGFAAAVDISHSGGITCTRDAVGEVRCFGRIMSTVLDSRALQLPEPIDEMVGGAPLCVRGRKSQRWYCRDPFQNFFGGALPDDFTPLVDARGRSLGRDVASVAVDYGSGVYVVRADGGSGAFYYSGVRKPLRIDPRNGRPEPMRTLFYGGGVRADGRGVLALDPRSFVTRGEVQAIVSVSGRPCVLDDAGAVSCFDAGLERATVVVRDATTLDPHGYALTESGDVHQLVLDGERMVARRREGLPPIAELAGPCGRTADGDLWCWGTVEHLPGTAYRLEPRPVLRPS